MENVEKLGIIPARYGSTRFPGKPLAKIGGVPMIERVYKQAQKSELDRVLVATDDERIADCVRNFGGDVVMTDPHLASGTDRCRAALANLDLEPNFVVNVQGDEPFINPKMINKVLRILYGHEVNIATLISPARSPEEIENPNRVKVVVNRSGKALYFSRLPIPYAKDVDITKKKIYSSYYIHLGLYGFKYQTLMDLDELEVSKLERFEGLEQLRWMEDGYSIYTIATKERAEAVDTPGDLKIIEKNHFL